MGKKQRAKKKREKKIENHNTYSLVFDGETDLSSPTLRAPGVRGRPGPAAAGPRVAGGPGKRRGRRDFPERRREALTRGRRSAGGGSQAAAAM